MHEVLCASFWREIGVEAKGNGWSGQARSDLLRAAKSCTLEWLEATIIYLPEEERTSIYVRPALVLATLLPGACLGEPFNRSCGSWTLSFLCTAEPVE
jgi:hypothetical protein